MATEVRMENPVVTLDAAKPRAPEAAADEVDGLSHIEAALRHDPHSFSFFQAVRVLERLRPGHAAPGQFVDPATEFVRFGAHASIAFPPSEIQELDLPEDEHEPARMTVNFMGVTGPLGVLPHQYTLLLRERQRAKDGAAAAFLDLFHHRIISLFYRAWEKHRFTLAAEKDGEDPLRDHLLDLVGMGLPSQRQQLPIEDEALIHFGSLLGPQQRSAVALEQLIEDFFDVPVAVEQFVGGWYPLPRHDLTAVGEENGASTRLGMGAVAGDEIWDQQARVRVRLGPLSREQFDAFLPTGSAHEPLRALLRFFSHDQFDFEAQLVLAQDQVPGLVLGDADQPLGWGTWVRTRPSSRDADETILTL
jgi:type VI secretion system protein ImpH